MLHARKRAGLLNFAPIHSAQAFELLITAQALADGSPLRQAGPDRLSSTRNYLELAGTLHILHVGDSAFPALALFDAGFIKYDGDAILRAELHTLTHLSTMMLRMLDRVSSRADASELSAAEIIAHTQTVAARIGLSAALSNVRGRVTRYVFAHRSLQSLPSLLKHAEEGQEAFDAREERYRQRRANLLAARARRNDLYTEQDREAQIDRLFAAAAAVANVSKGSEGLWSLRAQKIGVSRRRVRRRPRAGLWSLKARKRRIVVRVSFISDTMIKNRTTMRTMAKTLARTMAMMAKMKTKRKRKVSSSTYKVSRSRGERQSESSI